LVCRGALFECCGRQEPATPDIAKIPVEPRHALAQRRISFITDYPVGVVDSMRFKQKMAEQTAYNNPV